VIRGYGVGRVVDSGRELRVRNGLRRRWVACTPVRGEIDRCVDIGAFRKRIAREPTAREDNARGKDQGGGKRIARLPTVREIDRGVDIGAFGKRIAREPPVRDVNARGKDQGEGNRIGRGPVRGKGETRHK